MSERFKFTEITINAVVEDNGFCIPNAYAVHLLNKYYEENLQLRCENQRLKRELLEKGDVE